MLNSWYQYHQLLFRRQKVQERCKIIRGKETIRCENALDYHLKWSLFWKKKIYDLTFEVALVGPIRY